MVDMHINRQRVEITFFMETGTALAFFHTEAIAMDMAQCNEGQTPVFVSSEYKSATISVKRFSRGKSSGLRSCLLGKNI